MRWVRKVFGHKPKPKPEPSPEVKQAAADVQKDWPKVNEVAARSERLLSRNGFVDALTRAQEGKRR
jgi:hypothetical protein